MDIVMTWIVPMVCQRRCGKGNGAPKSTWTPWRLFSIRRRHRRWAPCGHRLLLGERDGEGLWKGLALAVTGLPGRCWW